jgi:hypothetical protein
MLGRFNNFLNRMVPPSPNLGGLLSAGDQREAANQYRATLASGLLSAAGPQRRPVSLGQAIGNALPEAMSARSDRIESGIRNDMLRRQIEEIDRRRGASSALNDFIAGSSSLTPELKSFVGTAAKIDPSAAMGMLARVPGLLGPVQPEISDAGRKLRDVGATLGRDLTEREVFALSGASGLFDPADNELDKPLSPTDLGRVRRPDGSAFPLGTTFREAQEGHAGVFSADDLKRKQSVDSALGLLNDLKKLQGDIDESGVIPGVGSNMLARLANGVGNAIGAVVGTEASDARAVFRDLSRGTIAPLVRTLGDAGALSDGDVERALALLPDNGGLLPDSTRLAGAKLDELEQIFRRAAAGLSTADATPKMDAGGGVRFLGFE